MPLSLKDFLDKQNERCGELPLFHTTDCRALFDIKDSKHLVIPTDDRLEKFLFMFFGRPAYIPNARAGQDPHGYYLPVSLIFKPEKVQGLKRIFPFDSGGFAYYKNFMHKETELAEFELPPDLEFARRAVKYFFGNERDYLWGREVKNLVIPKSFPAANSYYALLTDTSIGEDDTRRSSIEVQVEKTVPLKDTLEAIILPELFMQDDSIQSWIQSAGIKYFSFETPKRCNAERCVNQILERAADYLRDRGGVT